MFTDVSESTIVSERLASVDAMEIMSESESRAQEKSTSGGARPQRWVVKMSVMNRMLTGINKSN